MRFWVGFVNIPIVPLIFLFIITRALFGGVFGIHVSYFYMDVGGQVEMGSRSA